MNKEKPENVHVAGFRITRILTDYAQKIPGHWSLPRVWRREQNVALVEVPAIVQFNFSGHLFQLLTIVDI